jgi:sec-independent protein translocase protein TatB
MFDFSFSELLLCFVVALIVLGPERLPGVARTVGKWTGKARGYMRNLTAELERETELAELKRQLQDAHKVLREHADFTAGEARRAVEYARALPKAAMSEATPELMKPLPPTAATVESAATTPAAAETPVRHES